MNSVILVDFRFEFELVAILPAESLGCCKPLVLLQSYSSLLAGQACPGAADDDSSIISRLGSASDKLESSSMLLKGLDRSSKYSRRFCNITAIFSGKLQTKIFAFLLNKFLLLLFYSLSLLLLVLA